MARAPVVIGVDIGASKMLAGTVTRDGKARQTLSAVTPATSDATLSQARRLCERLLDDSDCEVLGIGIGSAGIVDAQSGRVLHANDNLPGWSGTDLSAIATPGMPVVAENDARALAFGEATLGAGRHHHSLLCVTVGTGIGGGIILDGKVWHGAGYCAGEIGYLVVGWAGDKPLILDQFVSGPAIERAWQAESGSPEKLPLTDISGLAEAGDAVAARVIRGKARQFGIILAGIAASLAPDALVIGGGVPQIGDLWRHAFEAGFRESAPPLLRDLPLLPARLGVEAVMLGAALLAWRTAGI